MPIVWDPFSGMLGGFTLPPAGGGGGQVGWCAYQIGIGAGGQPPTVCIVPPNGQPPANGVFLNCYPSFPAALQDHPTAVECQAAGLGGGGGVGGGGNGGGGGTGQICYQLPSGEQIQLPPDAQPPPASVPCPPKPPAGVPEACGPAFCPDPSPQAPNALQDPNAANGWIVAGTSCDAIDTFAGQFGGNGLFGALQDVGWIDQSGMLPGFSPLYRAALSIPWVGGFLAQGIAGVMLPAITLVKTISDWIQASVLAQGCKPGPMGILAFRKLVLTWARRIAGVETGKMDGQLSLAENYICPILPPSISDANLARVRGEITVDQWRCLVRLNNVNEELEEPIYRAGREMLAPVEYSRAWLRGYIDDNDYDGFLQERGMLTDADRSLTRQLTEFLPPVTDVLHFIVRGIGDPQIVQRFGLLDEFDTLYTGNLVTWGEAAGIKKETMEAYHAAHWVVPSPGQLFTMLQRLRGDNVPAGANPADFTVTLDDVNRALRENAFAPFWRNKLTAIAYTPISRRDLLQAFQRGMIDEKNFGSRLQDLGLTADNAKIVAATYKARIQDAIRRETWYKLYSESAVTRGDAVFELQQAGYTSELIEQALDRADEESDAATRIVCLKSVGRQFATGGLVPGEAEALLLQAGLDSAQVQRLIVQWSCAAKSRGKEVPAAMLCKWYSRGLISPTEISARLVRVGYSVEDSTRIVAECIAETSEARLKARLKALRDEQLAEQRAKRSGAYVAKQSELAKAAVIKALTAQMKARQKGMLIQERLRISEARQSLLSAERASRALLKAASAEQRQEARIQVAAEAFAIRAGLDATATSQAILQAWSTATAEPGIDQDTALEAVLLAAHDKRATDLGSYLSLAQSAAQGAEAIESAVSAPNTPTSSSSVPAEATPAPLPGPRTNGQSTP